MHCEGTANDSDLTWQYIKMISKSAYDTAMNISFIFPLQFFYVFATISEHGTTKRLSIAKCLILIPFYWEAGDVGDVLYS